MDEGAAFGFFPQLRPRRRLQDPTASADVPLQVLRGRLAGLLGLPADIGNLIRSPQPMEAFGSYDYEQPKQLPYTTEQFLKELPLAPTAPVGQLAGQAASFVPLNPAPLVRGVQKIGTMVGEGMAERVATGRPMLPSLLAEPPSAMFAVEPNVPRMNLLDTPPETMTSLLEVKPQAPVSDLGFYSAAEQAALNLQRNKGSGQAFLNDLLKAENVKKDELQWMGVDDFLKDKPNVTKQEVQDFISQNKVDLQEVSYGNIDFAKLPDQQLQKEYVRVRGYEPLDSDGSLMSREEIIYELSGARADDLTKYQKYQLAGGENYREILLKLPQKETRTPNMIEYDKLGQQMFGGALNPTERARFYELENLLSREERSIALSSGKSKTSTYQSSHFDEPNILAHMRVNDRVDADGKKMLLVEEIQSDWHQAGREKGYKGKGTLRELPDNYFVQEVKTIDGDTMYVVRDNSNPSVIINKDYNRQSAINGVINELNASSAGGVPDAPFKDTWYQLSLKRLLKYAADNGYERVGLTTGKQQAERFDLSKQVDELHYNPQTFRLIAKNKGTRLIDEQSVSPEKLASYIGKEAASKVMAQEPNINGLRSLKGEELQVGGEGMKKYYDEIYPKFLDKYGKKWNARVGETQIKVGKDVVDQGMMAPGIGFIGETTVKAAPSETIRYIDITPEMKGAVSKGQPLFAATPALPLGAQGLLGEPEKKKELSLLD